MPDRSPQPDRLETARQQAGLSKTDLWLGYLALGGRFGPEQVGRYLAGTAEPDPLEYDVLAQVLNERFNDMELDSPVPYSDEARPSDTA
jgi:hypothetical protein